ncbi:MAG TPA: prolyl oligopeptidase family serine peptidase, partial [Magnetospirillum sp.]|nr:prolyl oligopeptidase family serine peptidase [Magnetospirillum sp.]
MLTLGTAVMAPDICAGVVAENPLTDMAKFSRFRDDGKLWIVEFGDTSGDAAALAAAAEWSPLHNLQPGRDYPATLIMACGNDQRVSPIHGRKMTAALQATGSRGPHLLLEKDGAGHGGAVTRDETAATRAEMLRFAAARTGLVWPKARAGG